MSLLIEMMFTFMKIGAFSFGGGYAMIPLFQKELVGHGWMLISEVADVVAISEMTLALCGQRRYLCRDQDDGAVGRAVRYLWGGSAQRGDYSHRGAVFLWISE